MIHQRIERREYRVTRQGADSHVQGRRTQKTIWIECPFCQAEVKAFVWSVSGNGKLCKCGAKFQGGEASKLVSGDDARNAGVKFELRETIGSKPGRYEVEIFAPDGQSFEGERHSLSARGGTLAEAREIALADARSTELVACAPDCDCRIEVFG